MDGALTATVVGTGLWRDTLGRLVTGGPLPTGVAPATGLALGIAAGQLVSPRQADTFLGWEVSRTAPFAAAVGAIVLLGVCLLYTRWTTTTATAWLAVPGSRPPAALSRIGQVIGAGAFGVGLYVWTSVPGVLSSGVDLVRLVVVLLGPLVAEGVVVLPLLAAVLYPLCCLLATRSTDGPGRSLFLDDDTSVTLPAPVLRPRLVVGGAVLLGLGAFVADRSVPGGLIPRLFSMAGGSTGDYDNAAIAVVVVVAVLVAAPVSFMVAVGVVAGGPAGAGTGPVQAVAAAVLAVYALVVATVLPRTIPTCTPPACSSGLLVLQFGTFLLALSGAVLVVGLVVLPVMGTVRRQVRRFSAGRPSRPVDHRFPPQRPRRTWALRLVAVIVAVTFVVPTGTYTTAQLTDRLPGGGILPDVVEGARPTDRPRDVSVSAVCAEVDAQSRRTALLSDYYAGRLRMATTAASSSDDALHTLGLAQFDHIRDGRLGAIAITFVRLQNYCWVLARSADT